MNSLAWLVWLASVLAYLQRGWPCGRADVSRRYRDSVTDKVKA